MNSVPLLSIVEHPQDQSAEERLGRKDSQLLRESLDDLFRKYDTMRYH